MGEKRNRKAFARNGRVLRTDAQKKAVAKPFNKQ
jgi:hypothetical protein